MLSEVSLGFDGHVLLTSEEDYALLSDKQSSAKVSIDRGSQDVLAGCLSSKIASKSVAA